MADPDSRARTHLANERTFLAWLRTGLGVLALGLAAEQFLERQAVPGLPLKRALVVVLLATSAALTVTGARRYLRGRAQIDAAAFVPATTAVVLSTALALALALVALAFVIIAR